MTDVNPYEPPRTTLEVSPPGDPSAPCPRCRNATATRVRFTWWGGALGPRLFSMVRCTKCSQRFNRKTGKAISAGAILIYSVVVLAIGLALAYVFQAFILAGP